MKGKLIILVQIAVLTVVHFFIYAFVSGALLSTPSEQPGSPVGTALALLAVSFLNTSVLSYIILRSRWNGWKLVLAIFTIFYGVVTVMSQIETAFFVTSLPPGMLPRLFLAGAIIAALFSSIAVLILGRNRQQSTKETDSRPNLSLFEWSSRLSLIVVAYLVLYFTFGYFIAWQNAAVRAYYGGTDTGSFLTQMISVLQATPWLLPLQVARAILWTGFAVLVMRMMKGDWWQVTLAVALLFSVVMNSQLLIPNPLMPDEVRMVHLVETASSNFLFGCLIVMVLRRWSARESARQANSRA